MRIWKFAIKPAFPQTIELPKGATILTVQMQGDFPQLWALCDETSTIKEKRYITIYGTGTPMPDDPGKYIATFQMHDGAVVFHAFEF